MSERIGVFVENNIVVNRVLWSQHIEDEFNGKFQHIEETTNHEQQPGIGWLWDSTHGFRPPQPFASWSWNGIGWEAPVLQPGDNYIWNEDTQTWDEIPTQEPTP